MNREALRNSLVQHEGIRRLPYEDSEGVLTIGIGHNLEERPLSSLAIQQILNDDIDDAIAELDRAFYEWREHSDGVQNVLVEMCFNLGAPRLAGFKKMWAALKRKDYETAADEMLDSKWAKQVGQRAKTLSENMRRG